jgi:hypothetical protein
MQINKKKRIAGFTGICLVPNKELDYVINLDIRIKTGLLDFI